MAGHAKALFVGITCGISAPYVLGQVEWAMQQAKYECGCNMLPTVLVRTSHRGVDRDFAASRRC